MDKLYNRPGSINLASYSGYDMTIGDGHDGSWYPYDGLVDDVFVFNRALSQSEIDEIYLAGRSS